MAEWNYERAVDYVENIVRFTREKSMDSLRKILGLLGNPQDSFSYIHVAGTNGKGSVCAYADTMLREAGEKVGLFTSPHLINITERIRVNGEPISEDEFTEVFTEVYDLVHSFMDNEESGIIHPTFFEWIYIMAMVYFARKGVKFGVIETGLGGRLDATNMIEKPLLTIITSISLDHCEILGNSIEEIAAEKAGIIKEGVPLICDGSCREALSVIRDRATELKAPLSVVYPEGAEEVSGEGFYRVKKILNKGKNIDFCLEEMYHEKAKKGESQIELGTMARYQAMNASLAFVAIEKLMQSSLLAHISEQRLKRCIYDLFWPARMEEICEGLIIDGAHNYDAVKILTETVEKIYTGRDKYLLFASASDKDHERIVDLLCSMKDLKAVIVTAIHGDRKTEPQSIADLFRKHMPDDTVFIRTQAKQALELGRKLSEGEGLLICTGSLYLAGELISLLREGFLR